MKNLDYILGSVLVGQNIKGHDSGNNDISGQITDFDYLSVNMNEQIVLKVKLNHVDEWVYVDYASVELVS